jgi:UDP-N-acetylglucosamine 2-epimerase (non-hydrolysing)
VHKLIYLVAGARPNFMKIAPIARALRGQHGLAFKIIHTNQHYDREMNAVFFEELGMPAPDKLMAAGGATHAQQTARIMVGFEEVCLAERPAAVLVVGDVDSTLACALVAKKMGIALAHVEAGLRSGDMAMAEEINRLATDSIADWLFASEPSAVAHLQREGKRAASVHLVGNVMVDNLLFQAEKLATIDTAAFETGAFKQACQQDGRPYGVLTLHRPSNVDDPAVLKRIAGALRCIASACPLVFPVHPRTRLKIAQFGIDFGENVMLARPQAYMAFLNLWKDAALVLTDSGGLQEETTALGVPCLTIRDNTERPLTIEEGSNTLTGTDPDTIVREASKVLRGEGKQGRRPLLWDGKAAQRIATVLAAELA